MIVLVRVLIKFKKMLKLGYPGGPIVEKYAKMEMKIDFLFPIPLSQSPNIEFSYSGLKNAVRLEIERLERTTLEEQDISDICACFQKQP